MILVDTSGLLANYDASDRHHQRVVEILARPQRRLLSPFVLAELDYLILQMGGQRAERTVLADVAAGAFELVGFDAADVAAASSVVGHYADLSPGLTDASLVVLADRYKCRDILTLDQRHFRAMQSLDGEPFRLLPYDE